MWIWLPIEDWNGRFQGTAGGGNAASLGANALAAAIKLGYAAAATDAGHALDVVSAAWVLNPDRSVNQQLSVNFAYLSIHDMTVVGKAATARYYGRSASYSYFNGCSTGGRQGMGQAQRYPDDYDGILSGAPALYVPQLAISLIWPQVVQNVAGGVLPVCKLAAFTQAAIAACDPLDGLTDGLISDVPDCNFDPSTLVGTETDCGPITEADADVVRKIHDGPTGSGGQSLWWGLTPGTNLTSVAQPAFADIIAYSVLNDPTFDWHSITEESLASYYDLAVSKMSEISTSNPDLRGFRDSGGKLVLWHGLADQLIPPQGTVWYYEQARAVLAAEGGSQPEDFARLFLAPGVAHCQGGYGPAPANADVLAALVNWVENGTPPDRLDGVQRDASGAVVRTRPLCPYPQVAVYNGQGDPNSAASFNCAAAA